MTRARWTLATTGLALATLWLAFAPPAAAEPAFAAQTGYRCSQCHVNRTGGGLRTAFGSLYTQTILPARTGKWRDGNNLLPANPEARFLFGANLRVQYLSILAGDDGVEDTGSFEIPEANAYLDVRLIPDRLELYLDETLGPGGASTRELFALFSFWKDKRAYIKAGKYLPAHGWRLPDDASFVRNSTGFTYSAPDTGVEFGIEPGRWSIHAGITNGDSGGAGDTNDEKKFSLTTVRRFKNWRVGVSGSNNVTDGARSSTAGVLGSVRFGRLTFLGEADWGEVRTDVETRRRIGYVEGNWMVSRGLNVKVVHDWLDPDDSVNTDERTRDSIGVEYIPYPFLQLRAFVRTKDGPPQVPGSRDDQFDLELHIFF